MNLLATVGRKVVNFFVEDALLGVATVMTVMAAATCRELWSGRPLVAGAVLIGGCLGALSLSVARTALLRLG